MLSVCTCFPLMMVPHGAETCRHVIEIFNQVILFITCARVGVIMYAFSDENEFFNYFRVSLKSSDKMVNEHSVSHAYVFSCPLL
jgi:gamma-glutamylcysteine synthetase